MRRDNIVTILDMNTRVGEVYLRQAFRVVGFIVAEIIAIQFIFHQWNFAALAASSLATYLLGAIISTERMGKKFVSGWRRELMDLSVDEGSKQMGGEE